MELRKKMIMLNEIIYAKIMAMKKFIVWLYNYTPQTGDAGTTKKSRKRKKRRKD